MLLTNNAGGNKIDLFLRRTLDYAVTWNPTTGVVDGTLTVTLHNDAPAKGLPDSLIGNAIDDPGPFEKPPERGHEPHVAVACTPACRCRRRSPSTARPVSCSCTS